jgi:hypothetical protein
MHIRILSEDYLFNQKIMRKINKKKAAAGILGIGLIQVVEAKSPEAGEVAKTIDWHNVLQLIIAILSVIAQYIDSFRRKLSRK